ncbi:MAG: OmpA family protein [Gammaproteobacteria bacterium]|nr:MAG: OmpA family protein [Gammaproteobacteria bacterium]
MRKFVVNGLAIFGCGVMAACSSVDKKPEQDPILPSDFKDVSVQFNELGSNFLRNGFFSEGEKLAKVQVGTPQYRVQEILGSPVDGSGQEWWFYDINLPLEGINDYLVCQYRIAFDSQKNVSELAWRRPQCRELYEVLTRPKPPEVQEITLSSDVLFAFDSAQLLDKGKKELDVAAEAVTQKMQLVSMTIVGHTDRLGSYAYNLSLSKRRAESVRSYLVSRGVPVELISIDGRGSSQPLVQCEGRRVTQTLKECLQPNRRVDITIQGRR